MTSTEDLPQQHRPSAADILKSWQDEREDGFDEFIPHANPPPEVSRGVFHFLFGRFGGGGNGGTAAATKEAEKERKKKKRRTELEEAKSKKKGNQKKGRGKKNNNKTDENDTASTSSSSSESEDDEEEDDPATRLLGGPWHPKQAESDPRPIRDFPYAAAGNRTVYFSTRDDICGPFGFFHGQRARITRGPLGGMDVTVVGVRGQHLYVIFKGESVATPLLLCYSHADILADFGMVPLSEARAVPITPASLPVEFPDRVRNFLQYAPDLVVEVPLQPPPPSTSATTTPFQAAAAAAGAGAKRGRNNNRNQHRFVTPPEVEERDALAETVVDMLAASYASTTTPNLSEASPIPSSPLTAQAARLTHEAPWHRTLRRNTVVVHLPPVAELRQRGIVGWSAEYIVPIAGAGGVPPPSPHQLLRQRWLNSAVASLCVTVVVPHQITKAALRTIAEDVSDLIDETDRKQRESHRHGTEQLLALGVTQKELDDATRQLTGPDYHRPSALEEEDDIFARSAVGIADDDDEY